MIVILKILQVLLALSILIIIHELGHFFFAKLFRIKVEKFYLFFDAWFACAFKGEIFARTGGILSPEDSREEIRYLCVPAFSDANGELAPIVDTAFLLAPSSRASDWALRANLRRIKAMLSVINPIYYDSLLQLGLMCETALEGDEDAFYKAREGFLRDFEAAMKLEKRVKSLLQKGI